MNDRSPRWHSLYGRGANRESASEDDVLLDLTLFLFVDLTLFLFAIPIRIWTPKMPMR
jgi:hypothetical protein